VVEFISRITSNENEPLVEYHFPDEHLFSLYTNSPYADIAKFLATRKIPHHLTPKE